MIDLNFGCPAKTVNKSRGGAVLLKEPELLHAIVREVRRAVPAQIPVTAKMRLGYDSPDGALECAQALAEGGAAQLVVHARTKVDGYKPPAHWEWVARVQDVVAVPVFANGEIWSVDDWRRCREISGAEDIMLGRGLVSRPDLARQIAAARAGDEVVPMRWDELLPLLQDFWLQARRKLGAALRAGASQAVVGHAHPQLSRGRRAVRRDTPGERLRAYRRLAQAAASRLLKSARASTSSGCGMPKSGPATRHLLIIQEMRHEQRPFPGPAVPPVRRFRSFQRPVRVGAAQQRERQFLPALQRREAWR